MSDSLDQITSHCQEHGVSSVLVGLTDLDGVIRGKCIDLAKFKDLADSTGGLCNCIFGWDIDDHLYDLSSVGISLDTHFTGWHTGFPDLRYRIASPFERALPGSRMPFFVGELVAIDGSAYHPLCPRSLLRQAIASLSKSDIHAAAGFEYEFFVVEESPHTLREQDYQSLGSIQKGRFGYSVLRAAENSRQLTDLIAYLRELDISVEGLHYEADPGTWEAALSKSDMLASSDSASLFKTFAKAYFQERDCVATFMAKWSMRFPGQSGHFHFSLLDSKNSELLQLRNGELNDIGRYALGGLIKFTPDLLPMFAPNVNSFTRLNKGAWAPVGSCWGHDNRTCAFRVIPGEDNRFHIENRIPGADSNPYLVAAATLAAVRLGIDHRIEPPAPIVGNAYDDANARTYTLFPPTLRESAVRMAASSSAKEAFGRQFVEHFAASRIWESQEAERSVNDWHLKRYFEAV